MLSRRRRSSLFMAWACHWLQASTETRRMSMTAAARAKGEPGARRGAVPGAQRRPAQRAMPVPFAPQPELGAAAPELQHVAVAQHGLVHGMAGEQRPRLRAAI